MDKNGGAKESVALRQAGAIPYRMADGEIQVLLVTSRDTGRWVIPTGNHEAHQTARDAAAREAEEEAGVIGIFATTQPLGFVPYIKGLKSGKKKPASIEVYPLLVERQKKRWAEKGQRKQEWFSVAEAAQRVDEPALALLIRRLGEITDLLPVPL